jgi:hypothetical protein
VTLEALRWLHDAKAAFIQLDHDASILTASIGSLDDARLRRAQALIANTEHRLAISRELLEAKLKGQLAVLESVGLDCSRDVREALASLDQADRIERVLIAEAKAAEAYWDAWAAVPMQFARRDYVPDHWRTFGMRRSPLTLGPRNAANPLNAMQARLAKSGLSVAAPIGPKPALDRARVSVRLRPIASTRCAQGRAIGADLLGFERVPQLRRQARDPQALILRSMPPRSARGGATLSGRGFPSRWASQARVYARSWSRPDRDARSPAPPCRYGLAAAQSRRCVAR